MALWLVIFATVALLLAGLGLYGVLSFAVTVRKSEFGIRMALGSTPGQVLVRVIGEGLALCVVGLAIGVAAGTALSRVASSLLFEVQLVDPAVLGGTLVALLMMGLLAPAAGARHPGQSNRPVRGATRGLNASWMTHRPAAPDLIMVADGALPGADPGGSLLCSLGASGSVEGASL